MDNLMSWQRFCNWFFFNEELGLQLDISRVNFKDDYFNEMEPRMKAVYFKIRELEGGEIANPDEDRMVGHYWLRKPEMAPSRQITEEIVATLRSIKEFTLQVHQGQIRGEKGGVFKNVLVAGIGGSSLGVRFTAEAMKSSRDKLKIFFIDNTDPDGMDRVFSLLGCELDETLAVIISKSGGTIETRNCMEEIRGFYLEKGLDFTKHAVAITQRGSLLDETRKKESWLAGYPMWDWVGGRTSVLSAVGLLPLALQGINIDLLLEGAKKCDDVTRREDTKNNPAALLALMWHAVTEGQGGKQMVILPYKDRLELLTKYLQQLIMESLGKERDLDGRMVKQGIVVYGNKGSTDQHSYLQQLFDGPDNFFVTFIEVLKDRETPSKIIAEDSTSGDYLNALMLGTRKALTDKGRDLVTITIREINEFSIGVLLALFERAVSMYAYLININAYHQPAVEAGKKAAGNIIDLKNQAIHFLKMNRGKRYTIEEIAHNLGKESNCEDLFRIFQHVVNNPDHDIQCENNQQMVKKALYFAIEKSENE